MKILYVAYPLLPVNEQSAGGAEQVLWTLEREMHRRGHDTYVAAANGSQIAGTLIATGAAAERRDTLAAREIEHRQAIVRALREHEAANEPFDLIHDMSGSFWRAAGAIDSSVLATLHLPRHFYPAGAFDDVPPNVRFNSVSRSQAATFADLRQMVGVVPNGIALDRFAPRARAKERDECVASDSSAGYLLWLGRICEEKGPHHALDVAHAAGERIIVAGAVYPFLYHQKFHAREVLPRLRRAPNSARFLSTPAFAEKVDLLRNAKALLLTSTVDETSSLVAMEAAACGTPVIALRRGAFPEVVADGITGFLVDDLKEMGVRIADLPRISPARCIDHAGKHYPAAAMADGYAGLYSGSALTSDALK